MQINQSATTHWQREFYLAPEWQDTLPTLWQLNQKFALIVIQNISEHSPCNDRTYCLAYDAQNAASALTPSFESLMQLEKHITHHCVDILHTLFFKYITHKTQPIPQEALA